MIVLLGPLADTGIAHLTMLLISHDIEFVILDPRNFTREWDLVWWLDEDEMHGFITLDDRKIDLADVNAIWAHMIMLPDRQDEAGQDAPQIANEQLATLIGFVDCFPGKVVNRPWSATSNSVKPYQARIIREHGFEPIRTLITTVPDEARAFYDAYHGEVIFKSISWRRSIVRRVNDEDLNRMEHVRNCPTMFQEHIVGTDIRVHTAGDSVFATEIGCSTDDYRYVPADGERAMRGITLPAEIEANCLQLSKALDMPIGGIDLRRTPEDRYHCFEVNPIPGYMFYEQFTGQRIGDAFLKFLCRDDTALVEVKV